MGRMYVGPLSINNLWWYIWCVDCVDGVYVWYGVDCVNVFVFWNFVWPRMTTPSSLCSSTPPANAPSSPPSSSSSSPSSQPPQTVTHYKRHRQGCLNCYIWLSSELVLFALGGVDLRLISIEFTFLHLDLDLASKLTQGTTLSWEKHLAPISWNTTGAAHQCLPLSSNWLLVEHSNCWLMTNSPTLILTLVKASLRYFSLNSGCVTLCVSLSRQKIGKYVRGELNVSNKLGQIFS